MILVIIPCGSRKIWDSNPHLGPTPAREAYTGAPFRVNRQYAELVGERWIILSAKYGLIDPETVIEDYEVTFKKATTKPVGISEIRKQLVQLGLLQYDRVIALGGKEYRLVLEQAFAGLPAKNLSFPFGGLPLGKAMQATKRAVAHLIAREGR